MKFLPIALLLLAILSIQVGASLAKSIFPVLGAQGVSALRLGIAAIILACAWRPWSARLGRKEGRAIAAYGLALGAMNLLFYLALERLPLGLAVALEFTGPLTVALLGSRRPADILWALLAAAGILLILPFEPGSRAIDLAGVGLALGAGTAWGLYIILGKRAGALAPAGVVTSLGMSVSALLALPFGVAHSGAELLSPSTFPVALAVAVLSSALPYSLEMFALKSMSSRNFGILMSLEPAVAALVGQATLGERLASRQWVAVACIMVASCGSSLSAGSAAPELPPGGPGGP